MRGHRVSRPRTAALLAVLCAARLVTGCAVGPGFKAQPPPDVGSYVAGAMPPRTQSTDAPGGAAQSFRLGRDLPGDWWTLFGSHEIDALIRDAMTRYPTIMAQQAALREAREDMRAGQGGYYPQLQGSGNAERELVSGATIAPGFPGFITNVFQATVGISYTFDVFGGERRTVERLRARVAEQDFLLEGSYLTLASNVATTAIQLASVREQIAATREVITLEQQQLSVIERQYGIGTRTRADVLQQRSNLATVRATLPGLQQQLAAAEHALAVLTGRMPADAAPVTIDLMALTLPADIPLSVPSALVAQRPDIRAQEAVMHEACAAVGIATANMLPQLTLTGAIGGESLLSQDLLNPAAGVWNVAGGITQPLFSGGSLRAKRRSAIAAYDQAGAQYRLTVLNAFQNVADTLTALDNDAQALKAQNDAVVTATESLELIKRQYDAGAVDYVTLLAAQQTYQQSRIAYVGALASRYFDTVALFQALGGGWWNRRDPGTLRSAL